ncbi:MAG: ATP-binding protein [Eubacteriaceae bacterium]
MSEMTIKAIVNNLYELLDFVEKEMDKHGLDQNFKQKIRLAVEEVFVNIASYSYPREEGNVKISTQVDDGITITFADEGIPFNPLIKKEEEDFSVPKIGGQGINLICSLMDDVRYDYRDGKNVLAIRKFFPNNTEKLRLET